MVSLGSLPRLGDTHPRAGNATSFSRLTPDTPIRRLCPVWQARRRRRHVRERRHQTTSCHTDIMMPELTMILISECERLSVEGISWHTYIYRWVVGHQSHLAIRSSPQATGSHSSALIKPTSTYTQLQPSTFNLQNAAHQPPRSGPSSPSDLGPPQRRRS